MDFALHCKNFNSVRNVLYEEHFNLKLHFKLYMLTIRKGTVYKYPETLHEGQYK